MIPTKDEAERLLKGFKRTGAGERCQAAGVRV